MTMHARTIGKAKGELYVECDGCGATLEADPGLSFWDFLEQAKTSGITFRRDRHGDWLHFCPDCTKELAKPNISKLTEGLR